MNNQRPLRFRTWAIEAKKWIKVNNYCICENGIYPFGISPETVIIQQWTGLKDSKGKEIYEGDIMASRGNYVTDYLDKNGNYLDLYNVVVWNIKSSRFALKPIDEYVEHLKNPPNPELDHPWVCDITAFKEVIGNIFETPELLNDKKHIDTEENNKYDDGLTECPNCSSDSWDGDQCYNCGAKDI